MRPFRLLTNIYLTLSLLVISIGVVVHNGSYTMFTVTLLFPTLMFCVTIVLTLVSTLSETRVAEEVVSQVANVRRTALDSMAGQVDKTLVMMTGLFIWLIGSRCTLFYLTGANHHMLLCNIPICYEILRVTVVKRLISKGLRHIRTSVEYMDRVEDTVVHTRKLLKCNIKLNETVQSLAGGHLIYTLFVVLHYIHGVWLIYGTGLEIPGAYANHLLSSVQAFVTLLLFGVVLAMTSSSVADEVSLDMA